MAKRNFASHCCVTGLTVVQLCFTTQIINAQVNWLKRGSEPGSYALSVDSGTQYNNQYAATLKSIVPEINGYGNARQNTNPAPYLGKRIRMTAYMKTKDVSDWTRFWLRIDGDGKPLVMDNMEDRLIKGTTDWKKYSLVLDVPQNATDMVFGAGLSGTGQIWFTNPVFDVVDNHVPATAIASQAMTYPVVKSVSWIGVLPVQGVDEVPDPKMNYKLLMELSAGIKNKQDSTAVRGVNNGLATIGRIVNLHAASGIPQKNIDVVAVVHWVALNALLNNETYKKKYGVDNPNLALLKELQDAGVKLIACGQTMTQLGIKKEELVPNVKISLTAQTALSGYQLKHYVYYDVSERN